MPSAKPAMVTQIDKDFSIFSKKIYKNCILAWYIEWRFFE